ncbi:hypothetical protein [Streptomyces sp. NPDC002767]
MSFFELASDRVTVDEASTSDAPRLIEMPGFSTMLPEIPVEHGSLIPGRSHVPVMLGRHTRRHRQSRRTMGEQVDEFGTVGRAVESLIADLATSTVLREADAEFVLLYDTLAKCEPVGDGPTGHSR